MIRVPISYMTPAVGILLVLPSPVSATPPQTSSGAPDSVVECRVYIGQPKEGVFLELVITDPKAIRQLIQQPIARAKVDPEPARYIVIGTIDVRKNDGTQDGFLLFAPWGRFKRGDKYMTADFTELRKALKRAVGEVGDFLRIGELPRSDSREQQPGRD